jgi:hypothetical protein
MNDVINKTIDKINKVNGTNNSKIYNSHLYWSQKPFNICDILIDSLSKPGDVICDPFMGSGVTVFESVKLDNKRRAIGIEINDYPIYLLETLLGKHNISDFVCDARDMIKKMWASNASLYETICPTCCSKNQVSKSLFQYNSRGGKVLEKVYFKCNNCKKNYEKIDENDISKFDNNDISNVSYFKNIDLIPDSRIAVRENESLFDIFTERKLRIQKIVYLFIDWNTTSC